MALSNSLIHDHKVAISVAILEVFVLNESEKREALEEIMARVGPGLLHFALEIEKLHKRLCPIPSKN